MYMACLAQILARDQGLASALCPGMLGRCEEPGLSGAGPCQGPVDCRPYLAWVAAALTREISKDLRQTQGVQTDILMLTCATPIRG